VNCTVVVAVTFSFAEVVRITQARQPVWLVCFFLSCSICLLGVCYAAQAAVKMCAGFTASAVQQSCELQLLGLALPPFSPQQGPCAAPRDGQWELL